MEYFTRWIRASYQWIDRLRFFILFVERHLLVVVFQRFPFQLIFVMKYVACTRFIPKVIFSFLGYTGFHLFLFLNIFSIKNSLNFIIIKKLNFFLYLQNTYVIFVMICCWHVFFLLFSPFFFVFFFQLFFSVLLLLNLIDSITFTVSDSFRIFF